MKINIKDYKIFIFCIFSSLFVNNIVAQETTEYNKKDIQDLQEVEENEDELLKTPFGVFNLSNTTGSVFRISGDELRKTSGDNLANALRGKVPGLRVTITSQSSDAPAYTLNLNGRPPSVLVDGQPRGLQVDLREVEEVIVLSDAVFNSLLGGLGDNGLIYVVTRGGKIIKPTIEVNYQSIIGTPTGMAKHLSSSEYANVINRASNNDGLGDIYSQEAIQAYIDGSDPINFPNNNYQEIFLKDHTISNVTSLNIYGGDEDVKYSAFLGYTDWKGIEKVGSGVEGRTLTFRTKIATKINDVISTKASAYGKFLRNDRAIMDRNTFFNRVNNVPANAYPLVVNDTAYVVSTQYPLNLLAELEEGGSRTDYSSDLFFDLGIDLDFNKYIKGLSYSTYGLARVNNAQSLQADAAPAYFTIENLKDINQQDSIVLVPFSSANSNPATRRNNVTTINRIFTYGGNLSYINSTDNGILNLNLSHLLYYDPNPSANSLDIRNFTANLNSSYVYKNKYVGFANLNSSSSAKFLKDNKTRVFPTVGAAWIVSNEKFLKDNKFINRLKFRGSYGLVGTEYDNNVPFYLTTLSGFQTGTYFGAEDNTSQLRYSYERTQAGNEDIDWIVTKQLNVGIELELLNKVSLNVNYFDNLREGSILDQSELTALYGTTLGEAAKYVSRFNNEDERNKGFNANISFRDNFNSFNYYINANIGYNKITAENTAEIQHSDEYRLIQDGEIESRSIFGYESDGLFTSENIGDALPQLGEVQIGDIKYKDLNEDGIINEADRTRIGTSTPRLNYGINVGFEYKGINLDVVGAGVGSYDLNLRSSSYYNHGGLGMYYASVNEDLPNGNKNPRLSTTTVINNNTNSDYWLVDGGFFRIANLELGYSLPESTLSNTMFTGVKLFFRGNNLAVFSKIKDLDPESLTAGLSNHPFMRTLSLGASINF